MKAEARRHRSGGDLVGFAAPVSFTQRVPRRAPTVQCEGPGVDPWVTQARDRLIEIDDLGRYAIGRYGAPTACEGRPTGKFDGNTFGRVVLTFAGGVTLELETQPPEASLVTLRAPSGFADAGEVRTLLRDYAKGIGLSIDWATTPEITSEGDETVHRFRDPDNGLNASASLYVRRDTLVAVRLSLAL